MTERPIFIQPFFFLKMKEKTKQMKVKPVIPVCLLIY